MTAVTLPTMEQLEEAGFDPACPPYPPVTIDGELYRGLRDITIDLVPEWAGRRDEVRAACRAVALAAAYEAVAADARRRLAETDHWTLQAAEAGEPLSQIRRAYRNALRVIAGNPAGVTAWPVRPASD